LNKVENSSESGGGKALPISPAIELERSKPKLKEKRERMRMLMLVLVCSVMLCSAQQLANSSKNRTRGFCVKRD